MTAAPVVVGAVYIEEDSGKDLHGDTFEVKFEGGVAGTELTRLVIDTDQGASGYGVADLIFDTRNGGLGADDAFALAIVSQTGIDKVTASVDDAGMKLIFDFQGFDVGDKLVFAVDVDEIQQYDPLQTDVHLANEGVDPIASGVEFQGSKLTASFSSPHYFDVSGSGEFRNAYDRLFTGSKLLQSEQDSSGLPTDDQLGKRDRSAGAAISLIQKPLPVSLSGYVYRDKNDNGLRESSEQPLAGVPVRVIPLVTIEPQASINLLTDANGFYEAKGLSPGQYRIVEVTQPVGLFDGKESVGTVRGVATGTTVNPGDSIEAITLLGGDDGVDYNFGELDPASLRGTVRLTGPDGDCDSPGSQPIASVEIQLLDSTGAIVASTRSGSNGAYEFNNLAPGTYQLVEVTPAGLIDGDEHPGIINGVGAGVISANDVISGIVLRPGNAGINFDFCEQLPSSISGFVYHDQNNDGQFDSTEVPISNVRIELRDDRGAVVGSKTTDERGAYEFTGIRPGIYMLTEAQPQGWLDGKDSVGQIDGQSVGVVGNDQLSQIALHSGRRGMQYNFGELRAGSIEGYVHLDQDDDCIFDSGELPLAGVTIQLLDPSGNELATAQTDANGHYRFDNLPPGTYQVRELQPAGFLQGGQTVGSGGGEVTRIDSISKIAVGSGQRLVDYNFCEVAPSSIAGMIHADTDQDCEWDANESRLGNVQVELLDASGRIVASTTTDNHGQYRFGNLRPGTYSIREIQPIGYFDGGQTAGTGGGNVSGPDLIQGIDIGAGVDLVDYNFCELPPSRISGRVFQDGPALQVFGGNLTENVMLQRDGLYTSDDTPIAGVVLELRHGIDGTPIMSDVALPGYYPAGPIQTITDANGYFEFAGIPGRNSYAIYQQHPVDYIDSIDTPGSTSGFVFNAGAAVPEFVLQTLTVAPRNDAIVRIPLAIGQSSDFNHFSEVRIAGLPLPEPTPIQVPPPPASPRITAPPVAALPPPWLLPTVDPLPIFGARPAMSWHLSIIDAGVPRGLSQPESPELAFRTASVVDQGEHWTRHAMKDGEWFVMPMKELEMVKVDAQPAGRQALFGIRNGIPISGDFNGDGNYEFGIYYKGEWFIDVNGNGVWDDADLWARLGNEDDTPVVGDWNGDGKDDIGIFGPEWSGDRRAIAGEPGLPNLTNTQQDKPKNLPPDRIEATDGHRVLQLTREGKPRADLIDHVFRYGRSADYPVAGDWDGDGIDTIGIFRDGRWTLDSNGDGQDLGREVTAIFGKKGDLPVTGDFDGDGVDEIGIYRAGVWYIDSNHNLELDAHDRVFELGTSADRPVVGDWDADGLDDPGLYREVSPAPPSSVQAGS